MCLRESADERRVRLVVRLITNDECLAALTLILMAYLLATGILEIVVAFQLRPADGWGLELFSGAVTLLLGILLWRQFPLSGAWAIGILFGIKMVFSGWAFVFIGRAARKLEATAG